MKFTNFLKNELNTEQRIAVEHTKGPLLVVAGAGSGKTRVITARITNLIVNHQVLPEQILALTFTNKAGQEMKARITNFLPQDKQLPFVGTFHSYCLQLLKKHPDKLTHPFFSVLDTDDQQKLLQGIITRNNLKKRITAKQLSYHISQIKNQTIQPEEHPLYQANSFLQEAYHAYEQEKAASKCLDFDDLLIHALKLFTSNKDFKKEFQQHIRHVLVDEYQDTNVIQHQLLHEMAKHNKKLAIDSVCAVGDEDQSIYSWRGATVANIMNFQKDFPKTTVIKIEQNYRSVQPILDIANQVIANNKNRNPKALWSDKKARDRIRHCSYLSEYQEGIAIAQLLKVAQKKQSLNTIAILYRTHFQSRAIEEALVKESIPYKIIGGIQFYERKEIKDVLAYIRLIVNPFDRASLFRIINTPTRGLGAKFEELFYERWNKEPLLTFSNMIDTLIQEKLVVGKKKDSLQQFAHLFEGISATQKPTDALECVLERSQYLSYVKDQYELDEANTRIDNIKELLNAAAHFETNGIKTIEAFLDEVALMQDHRMQNTHDREPVSLMTFHAAKGLEFHTVILAGLEHGILPSNRSLQNEDQIEEERRLFYVGITRAQERLFLSRSRYRYTYGQMTDQIPSDFLKEIPNNLALEHDGSRTNELQQQQYFAQWLNINVPSPTAHTVMTFGAARKATPRRSGPIQPKRKTSTRLRKNQPVKHNKFGVGIIQKIEQRGTEKTFVTVKFKAGIKKIDAQFLTIL